MRVRLVAHVLDGVPDEVLEDLFDMNTSAPELRQPGGDGYPDVLFRAVRSQESQYFADDRVHIDAFQRGWCMIDPRKIECSLRQLCQIPAFLLDPIEILHPFAVKARAVVLLDPGSELSHSA